jgi:signal transduction histidine kinase/ActR/RegA family two-component response regulator
MHETADSGDLRFTALPMAARVYVGSVLLAGGVTAITFFPRSIHRPVLFALLILAGYVTSTWKVNLPLPLANGSTLSVSYAADLMSMLLLGPQQAMVVAMTGVWAQCMRAPKQHYPVYRTLFSIAAVVLTMRAIAMTYTWLNGPPAPSSLPGIAAPLIAVIAVYFVMNTGLIALAVSLATGQPTWSLWRDNFLWSAPSFIVAGFAGALAAILVTHGDFWLVPLLVAPVYLAYRTYHVFLGRIEDERRFAASMASLHRQTLEALSQAQDAEHALHEQRLKASKLESLGLLAGGIAHDFNNILTAILGNVSLARNASLGKQADENLVAAEEACDRARQLTQQLLTFSKGGAPIKKPLRLDRVISESVRIALSGSTASSMSDTDPALWTISADESQIRQVLHNVIINAMQAMPSSGLVSVMTRNIIEPVNRWEFGLRVTAGPYVRLSIADEGSGINPSDLPKIFDPYFSTKPGSAGLGLATSRSIVKNHGGYIAVDTAVGRGTVVHIALPAMPSYQRLDHVDPAAAPVSGSGRILVLDDEEPIRTLTTQMLIALGYRVDAVARGSDAIESYKKARIEGRPFDLLLLDLTIPGDLGGREVLRELMTFDPGVKAVVVSGYTGGDVLANYRDYGFKAVVAKPFTMKELSAAVLEVASAHA